MRGKPLFAQVKPLACRNIPAHAGKTLAKLFMQLVEAEHPRACGENVTHLIMHDPEHGTSPRMRGKLGTGAMPRWRSTEHPRACGENLCVLLPTPP